MRRRRGLLLGLLAAAISGVVVGLTLASGPTAPATAASPPVAMATIVRTDLQSTTLTAGTLGYAPARPLVNRLTGTYTQLPLVGATIRPAGTLYRVDNDPVTLLRGWTPAWRAFELGMSDGSDVRELQENLVALGYATGLFTRPDGHYGWLTAAAVERWQASQHQPATGAIAFGQVVFEPSPVRVGAETSAPGDGASPGQSPYQATSTARDVVLPSNPTLASTRIGDRVSIILPSGQAIPGRITQITPAAAGGQGSGAITVAPLHALATGRGTGIAVQVSLTTDALHGVLAAPVSALLALAGGGFGVEVVEPSGAHRLVGVRTGLFTGSQVQISGPTIVAGMRVVVAQ